MILLLLSSCFRLNFTKEIICYDVETDGSTDIINATVTLVGEMQDDQAGFAVVTGDVDGNGLADILISAPENDGLETDAGKVYLILDSSFTNLGQARTVKKLADASYQFIGDQEGLQVGYSLFLGDVDGDEQDDIIIGAPYYDNDETDVGAVAVFLAASLEEPATFNFSDADYLFFGAGDYDELGKAISVGDVDGDGRDDLLLGSETGGAASEGRAYLFLMASVEEDGRDQFSAHDADYTFVEGNIGERLGASVSNTADLNGDGLADIAIGVPENADTGLAGAGKVSIFMSSSLESVVSVDGDVAISDAGHNFYGLEKDAGLGNFVSLANGSSGDGYLLIGTGETVYPIWESLLSEVEEETELLSQVPFVDASKVVVGEEADIGSKVVLIPNAEGVFLKSLSDIGTDDDSTQNLFNSKNTTDQFSPVPALGDLNNDGLDEVIIGNPVGTSNDSDEQTGEVYIFIDCSTKKTF